MIRHVLYADHIKDLKADGQWPKEFDTPETPTVENTEPRNIDPSNSSDEDDIPVNPNHQLIQDSDEEQSSDDD